MGASAASALFWHGFVLPAPLLFLLAPSIWRNVCPPATLNHVPRVLGMPAGRRLPPWLQRAALPVSGVLLVLIVVLRPIWFDRSPPALATFDLLLLGLVFVGGIAFGGMSGWCTSFCPMLTIERFYGSSPLLVACLGPRAPVPATALGRRPGTNSCLDGGGCGDLVRWSRCRCPLTISA